MTANNNTRKAVIVLEDRKYFRGKFVGKTPQKAVTGEAVFNTAMSGYQEIITDPSYTGQFVIFTYPSIGNYGINSEDNESDKPHLSGIIIRDYFAEPSNFRSEESLVSFLNRYEIPAVTGVDTRALVRHIREKGSMKCGIFAYEGELSDDFIDRAVAEVQQSQNMEGADLASVFTGSEANRHVEKTLEKTGISRDSLRPVAVLDFGIKFSILDNFIERGFLPEVFAGGRPRSEWKDFNPDRYAGFFFSNGPGDPSAVTEGIGNIKYLLSLKKPSLGICLGHQMISLALGAKTYKLKFGHHGGNQPVKADHRANVIITSQNHGFAVDEASLREALGGDTDLFEINPNDNTVEGFLLKKDDHKLISVQYHPEAAPGPHDAAIIFDEFEKLI